MRVSSDGALPGNGGLPDVTRRRFLSATLVGALAAGLRGERPAAAAASPGPSPAPLAERVCLFTDHLAGHSCEDVARQLEALTVAGPDLTARPGGLVPPESVERDLPRADAAFRDRGLTIPMVTSPVRWAGRRGGRPRGRGRRRPATRPA